MTETVPDLLGEEPNDNVLVGVADVDQVVDGETVFEGDEEPL